MSCGTKEAGGVYRPRHPQQSPFYRLVERFFPQFEAVYEERYQERYGFWRPIVGTVVRKFLECGDLKHGFARVRCPKCREEFLVPYSCRGRCFCPSCHQKRALEKAGWVSEHVCAEVPHRQFVFTIPKRLRIYLRFERRLLGELCRAAARTVITVYRAASGRPDAVPGMVGAIQTFGQLVHFHPHIHALVSEGVFLPQGTFLPLPKLATEPFLKLWEQEIFALLLAEGKITEDVVVNMRSWKHSGFSVDQSVRLEAGDREGVQRLIQYFLRCPFSQARMIEVTEAGKVIYKTEHNAVGRFPEPGDEELLAGPSRNFQVFDPLDFLAEVAQHIPDPGSHLVRYYGWYSNKTRGQRAQRQPAAAGTGIPARSPSAREARKGWAALIKQVYASDPICCPKCGAAMKIIAFIERHQTEVHRAAPDRGHREDSPALRTVGRALSSRPARGEGPGYGLRLRARGTGGAAASRARWGIRSTVNCTRKGRCTLRFQALSPSDRLSWSLRAPFGAGGRPPTCPERAIRHLAGTILLRIALNGYTWSGTLHPRRKSKFLSVMAAGGRLPPTATSASGLSSRSRQRASHLCSPAPCRRIAMKATTIPSIRRD